MIPVVRVTGVLSDDQIRYYDQASISQNAGLRVRGCLYSLPCGYSDKSEANSYNRNGSTESSHAPKKFTDLVRSTKLIVFPSDIAIRG